MAFRIEKRYKGANLELTDGFLIDKDEVAVGRAVTLAATAGEVETADGGDTIVGVIAAKYSFPATDPLGPDANDNVRCLMTPITTQTPIIADVITVHGTPGTVVPGYQCGIYDTADANDALGLDATDVVNTDFTVVKVLERDGDGAASKVLGYFTTCLA